MRKGETWGRPGALQNAATAIEGANGAEPKSQERPGRGKAAPYMVRFAPASSTPRGAD